jgi:hypothetical protein
MFEAMGMKKRDKIERRDKSGLRTAESERL